MIRANEKVTMNRGKAAIMRGPLLYCCENTDNPGDVSSLIIQRDTSFTPHSINGFPAVICQGFTESAESDSLYSSTPPTIEPCSITAIPYSLWQNRGPTNMTVWLREK